jgi:murein DD-endopeptidase MepM/ murein hydrolase activator NlpD
MPPDTVPDRTGPVLLDLPFRGRWQARNSPARRVPSHGTHRFGVTYAIDFVAVDGQGRSAPRSWRSVLSVEPPEIFSGFGMPILTPVAGTVVLTHDGEADHVARRSAPAQIPYAFGQVARVRAGAAAIAGNHVVLGLGPAGPYVLLAHLRRGTVRVTPGDELELGAPVGECGNSGNSTEPHVHLQATDSVAWETAVGLPIAFRRPSAAGGHWVPAEGEIVDAG